MGEGGPRKPVRFRYQGQFRLPRCRCLRTSAPLPRLTPTEIIFERTRKKLYPMVQRVPYTMQG